MSVRGWKTAAAWTSHGWSDRICSGGVDDLSSHMEGSRSRRQAGESALGLEALGFEKVGLKR